MNPIDFEKDPKNNESASSLQRRMETLQRRIDMLGNNINEKLEAFGKDMNEKLVLSFKPLIHMGDSTMKNEKLNPPLSGIEKEELKNRIRALRKEELLFVLDQIPVELCLERVRKEMKELQDIKETIRALSES